MSDMLSPESEAGRKMTLEEWADLPEDVPGELVDGHLVEEEMPDIPHEAVLTWLIQYLAGWCRPLGGLVLASGIKYGVAPDRGRKPDLSVYLPGAARPPGRSTMVRTPPSIAVEIVSPQARDRRRDRVEKLEEYARFGIPWYWIVDPRARTLEIFELRDRRYLHVLGASREAISEVPGCVGLSLDLEDLWSLVDELDEEE